MTDLPRLLVISDVAVERTGAGSLLLYRLLRDYPADRLRIFYGPEDAHRDPSVRLPGVDYRPVPYRLPRLVRNKFNPFWPAALAAWMPRKARVVFDGLDGFEPEAVVSVANKFLWLTAASVARKKKIPLHLFLHEEWPNLVTRNRQGSVWDLVRAVCRAQCRGVFRRAASLFSVSPGMSEDVEKTYGLKTTLVYPSRGDDSPEPVVRVRPDRKGPPVVAHAGFIHLAGNAHLIRQLAAMLEAMGGRLDLYTTYNENDLRRLDLTSPAIRLAGFFPASEMARRLGETADALFLSASFDAADRADVGTLFPSKLADYTGVGLPIVAWGPSYSSAARWAAANPGATILFTDPDPAPVREALVGLANDPAESAAIASRGIEAGKRYFDLEAARAPFLDALRGVPGR